VIDVLRISSDIDIRGIEIFSIGGLKVMDAGLFSESIDLSMLSGGLYMAIFHTEKGNINKLIVKK
jgi:hypothetical protein